MILLWNYGEIVTTTDKKKMFIKIFLLITM